MSSASWCPFASTPSFGSAVRRNANAPDLESSKLKLLNSEFGVVKRVGNNYEIQDVITGKITTANVTQIARIRSVAPPAPEPPVVDASEKTWDRMEEGKFCVVWVKDEEKSVLRVLEVLEVEVQSKYLLGWHFIHKGQGLLLCVQPGAAARTTAARTRVGASADAAIRWLRRNCHR